jgi:hypothetical protein
MCIAWRRVVVALHCDGVYFALFSGYTRTMVSEHCIGVGRSKPLQNI